LIFHQQQQAHLRVLFYNPTAVRIMVGVSFPFTIDVALLAIFCKMSFCEARVSAISTGVARIIRLFDWSTAE